MCVHWIYLWGQQCSRRRKSIKEYKSICNSCDYHEFKCNFIWFSLRRQENEPTLNLKLGGIVHTHTNSSINSTVHLCCLWWVLSPRSITWLTSRNVGARCRVCPSRPPDCISHTWRLPWAYQPVISWLKSTMSHSVNIHSWWRLAHLPRHPACILLFHRQNVAQYIYSIFIFLILCVDVRKRLRAKEERRVLRR